MTRGVATTFDVYTDREWAVVHFLQPSAPPLPSVIPGVVSLSVGNGFSELIQVAVTSADVGGHAPWTFTIPSSLFVFGSWSFEVVAFDPNNLVAPLAVSGARTVPIF